MEGLDTFSGAERRPVLNGDVITPPGPSIRMAERTPNARLERYPGGHFDFYVGEGFERVILSQTAFFREALEKSGGGKV